ncbi:MAG: oligosaccharide flippase family protein, partial [Candidatus Fermentibacteraceae bacterium]
MKPQGRRANSILMLGGQITGKAGLLVSLMIYSRLLEDADFGRLALSVALGVLVLFLGDMGVSVLVTRRLSSGEGNRLVDEALTLRLFLSIAGMALIISFGMLQGYDALQMKLLFLVSAGFVFDGFCETFYSRFRAGEKMVFEAVSRAALGFFAVMIALVALAVKAGPVFAGVGYLVRTLPSITFCYFAALKTGYVPVPRFEAGNLLNLFRSALPLGLMGLFFAAAQRLDSTFIKAALGDEAVAAYQQCVRVHEPLVLLVAPTLLPGALFPDLCRAVNAGWEHVRTRIAWMTEAFLALAALACIPLWNSGHRFLALLWGGNYLRGLDAATVLLTFRLVLLLVPVTFVFHLFLAVYLAEERLKRVPVIVGAALVVQLTGLFLLTGRFGIEAAAALQCLSVGLMALALGWGCRMKHGATGFLRGLWRPLTALLATLAVATVFPIPLKALSETALFLAFWLLLGGRAVLRFPGRLSPENGAAR